MPRAGDPCTDGSEIEYDDTGVVLVCRSGVWQYVGEPAPPIEAPPPSDTHD